MTDHNCNSNIQQLTPDVQQLAREVLAHHLKHNLCLSEDGDRKAVEATARNIVAAFVELEGAGQQGDESMPADLDVADIELRMAEATVAMAKAHLDMLKGEPS